MTPVNGATIAWSSTNGIEFSACGAAAFLVPFSPIQAGEASTWVTPTATGAGTITAQLAPASYSSAQTQQTTLVGSESALDLAAIAATHWIAKGATLAVPLTVEALDLGVPQANVAIQFTVVNGTASLSSTTATTSSAGLASVTAQVANLSATVQVSACVSPANAPCQTFTLFAVPASSWKLEAGSGTASGRPQRPVLPTTRDAGDGRLIDRQSCDGSERHVSDHARTKSAGARRRATPGQRLRRPGRHARHPRDIANTSSYRAGWTRFDRADGWEPRSVRCVHHRHCGGRDCAV